MVPSDKQSGSGDKAFGGPLQSTQLFISRCSVRNRRTFSVLSGRDGATESCFWRTSGYCQLPATNCQLPAVVRERLVRFRHLVRILALLDRVAAVVGGIH